MDGNPRLMSLLLVLIETQHHQDEQVPATALAAQAAARGSAWRRRASSLRLAASAIPTTTLSPKRSMASTRPRSSIGADRGGRSKPSSSRRWNGSTGSTTGGSWSPSATSRRPKPSNATTPCWNNQPWRRNSNQIASEEPGAVQVRRSAAQLSKPPTEFIPTVRLSEQRKSSVDIERRRR